MIQSAKPNDSVMLSGGNKRHIAPEPDEIEVSVFGPGYGECIALHIGANKWIIVDSCIDPVSGEPAPLTYFRQINLDPSTAVQQVIATHWHDDHVRGLGSIFRACTSARFVCSDALRTSEFVELVEAYGTRSMMRTSGVQEMHEIMELMQKRCQALGNKYLTPKFAVADRCLWHCSLGNTTSQYNCSIHALSPSDASIVAAKQDILKLFPQEKETKRRLLPITPNHTAIVLWVKIANFSILLGSDLEETGDKNTGWSVIIHSHFTSDSNPYGKASFFKIPHHGSQTAHHPGIWTEMLYSNPVAILTPFSLGGVNLPTENDVTRICSFTDTAYSTARMGLKQKRKRNQTVEKTIRETVHQIKKVNPSIGHVRFRAKLSGCWDIELFGDALPLNQLYSSN